MRLYSFSDCVKSTGSKSKSPLSRFEALFVASIRTVVEPILVVVGGPA